MCRGSGTICSRVITWLTQPNLESAGQLEAGLVGLLPLQRSLLIERQGGRASGRLQADSTGYWPCRNRAS